MGFSPTVSALAGEHILARVFRRAAQPNCSKKICLCFLKGCKAVEGMQLRGEICKRLADVPYSFTPERHKKEQKIAKFAIFRISLRKAAGAQILVILFKFETKRHAPVMADLCDDALRC